MREIQLLLGLLVLVFTGTVVYAPLSAEVDPQVLSAIQEETQVSVIINLKENGENIPDPEVAKETLADAIAISGGDVEHTYETVNAISATVTESQIAVLAADPSVESIGYNVPVYALLEQSVPLIRANLVHAKQSNGVNVTGKGTTVCVIDTGVDYNHAALGGCFGSGCKVIGGYDFVNDDSDPMDDNGHGTHVAGIIAAKGSLTGVAPDANIVAVKALGASGSGGFDDITAAIDWCVTNRAAYNISVISMSIGTRSPTVYDSYCDSVPSYAAMAAAIDVAVANDILVTVATGNDGDYTKISSPACIKNATRITATDDADAYASFANRAATFPDIIAAPGVSINSTKASVACLASCSCSGTSMVCSGTSMATPEAAGVAALTVQRYKDKNGGAPTEQYLYDALNVSGVYLSDDETSATFSRIDALSSITTVGLPPSSSDRYNNVTNDNQTSFTVNESQSVFFNASFDQAISTYIWKKDGTTIAGATSANTTVFFGYADAGSHTVELHATNANGTAVVTWNVAVTNVNAPPQFNATLSNQTLEIDAMPVTISLASNITDVDGETVTITTNDTNITANSSSKTLVLSYSSLFSQREVVITLTDPNNATASQTIFVSIQDTQAPVVSIQSPIDGATYNNATVAVTASASGTTSSFLYSLNGGANQTFSSGSTIFVTANQGWNALAFWANDTQGNGNTTTVTFFVDSIVPLIGFVSPTPANGTSTNETTNTITTNTSITETNVDSVMLYVNGVVNQTKNSSDIQSGTVAFTLSNLSNGIYTYSVSINDTANNTNSTETRTYIVDATSPVITISSPGNNSYVSSGYVSIVGAVSDLTSVSLAINDTARFSNNNGTNTSFNYTNSSLVDGTYVVLLTATDTYGKASTALLTFTVDTVKPPSNISGLAASDTTKTATTLQWNEIVDKDVATYKIYRFKQTVAPLSVSEGTYVTSVSADNDGSVSKTVSGLSSGTTYWFVVTASDRAENENTTIHSANKISITTTASVPSSPPSGDPAPVTPEQEVTAQETVVEVPQETLSVSQILASVPYIFSVTKQSIGVQSITIDTSQDIASVAVTVEKLAAAPSDAEVLTATAYSYLKIEAPSLTQEMIETATIAFSVENAWIASQGLEQDEIALLRYVDGAWRLLSTSVVSTDSTATYYQADTPGFSYFAVASLKDFSNLAINEDEYELAQQKDGIPKSTLFLMVVSVGVVLFGVMWLRDGHKRHASVGF